MGFYTPDLYNQPEAFGLTPVGELDDPNANWSFDTFVVWQHEDGSFYFAQDAGCSCPSPFENYTSLDGAEKVESIEQFETEVKAYFNSLTPYRSYNEARQSWDSDDLNPTFQTFKAEVIELVRKVAEGL